MKRLVSPGTLEACATAAPRSRPGRPCRRCGSGRPILRESRDLDEKFTLGRAERAGARARRASRRATATRKRYPSSTSCTVCLRRGRLPRQRLADRRARARRPGDPRDPAGRAGGDHDPEYLNWGAGRNWETYVAKEVPRYVDAHFRTISSRDGRAIVGISAGGYGAMILGLHHLAQFSVIESWSGTSTRPIRRAPSLCPRSAPRRATWSSTGEATKREPTFLAFYVGRATRGSGPRTCASTPSCGRRASRTCSTCIPARTRRRCGRRHGRPGFGSRCGTSTRRVNPRLTHPAIFLTREGVQPVRDAGTGAAWAAQRGSSRPSRSSRSARRRLSLRRQLLAVSRLRTAARRGLRQVEGTAPLLRRERRARRPSQPVDVYLPPGYARTPRAATRCCTSCTASRAAGAFLADRADGRGRGRAVALHRARPLILVMPFGSTGSFTDKDGRTGSGRTTAGRRSSPATSSAPSTAVPHDRRARGPRDRRALGRRLRRDRHRRPPSARVQAGRELVRLRAGRRFARSSGERVAHRRNNPAGTIPESRRPPRGTPSLLVLHRHRRHALPRAERGVRLRAFDARHRAPLLRRPRRAQLGALARQRGAGVPRVLEGLRAA